MAETIGVIGTGIMGAPMNRRLLSAGYSLVVYDVRPEALEPLVAEGAVAAAGRTRSTTPPS